MQSIVKGPPTFSRAPTADTIVMWVVNHSTKARCLKWSAKKYVEAERLLQDVIVRHSKTPWADLAQDVLNRGLSVRLDEEVHNAKYYERAHLCPSIERKVSPAGTHSFRSGS